MITISEARLSNAKTILKLERQVWEQESELNDVSSKYDLGSFIRFGYVFVAKDKTKLVGVIIAFKTKQNDFFVVDWVVAKNYRKKRIGMRLYQKLLSSVPNYAVVTLIDAKNKISLTAHKKLGFHLQKKLKDAYGIGEKKYDCLVKKNRKLF